MKQVFSNPKFWPIMWGGIVLVALSIFGAPWWVLWLAFAASVLLVNINTPAKVETSPHSGIPSHLAPEVLSSYIRTAPNATALVSKQARITLCSHSLAELFPSVDVDQAFAQAFRAPALIDAITRALRGELVPPMHYQSTRYSDRVFEAKFTILKAPFAEILNAYLMVEFEDVSQSERNEAARRDFVANASHELRTPLTAIQGGIDTISQYQDDPDVAQKFLPIMKTQADRMQRLIDDLMSLSKIEGQRPVAKDAHFNLTATIQDVIEMYGHQKDAVQIENLFGKTKHIARGDSDQITQVLINLLDNAIKYGSKDNIQILKIKGDGKIGICVKDFGKGIEQAHLSRLSERFYRANEKQKTGTGLGLAIVKHILRRHGSSLDIESRIGEGSSFTFWLDI